jgi:hypothetical protein
MYVTEEQLKRILTTQRSKEVLLTGEELLKCRRFHIEDFWQMRYNLDGDEYMKATHDLVWNDNL